MSDKQPSVRFNLNSVLTIIALVVAAVSAFYTWRLSAEKDALSTKSKIELLQGRAQVVEDSVDTLQRDVNQLHNSHQLLTNDVQANTDVVHTNRRSIDDNNSLIYRNQEATSQELDELMGPRSSFTTKSYLSTLESKYEGMLRRIESQENRVEVYDMGYIDCSAPKSIPVPQGTDTDDWIVFGINPLVNSGVDDAGMGNNAIYQFKTIVTSNPQRTAWNVSFEVKLNYNTSTEGDSVGSCNMDRRGKRFDKGEISRMQLIAIKKTTKD